MDPSKSPFDDPEFPGKSESAADDASSATAIFGTVSAKPSPSQDDDLLRSLMGGMKASKSPAEPPKSIPSAPPQPSSRTPVAPPSAAPAPAPPAESGGFTQMFQALQKPLAPSASEPSSASGGFTDTFHSQRNPAPQAPATAAASVFTPPGPLPSSKSASDLSSVFKQIVVEKTPSTEKPAPPA